MAIRKDPNSRPRIEKVAPKAAIPGGEFLIHGKGFVKAERPKVTVGESAATVVVGSDSYIVAKVPDGAAGAGLVVENGEASSERWDCGIGVQIADSVHPVANPAVDAKGNVYTTLSGSRGQKTPVSVYKVERGGHVKPFLTDIMNATGIAIDKDGLIYISSRHDGSVFQATPGGELSVFVEGMGIATGLAFDMEDNLYVGDRQGTIFKISPSRQIYVFTTLEASIAAYHLAFGPEGYLYVTGPTTSSFDCVQRVSPAGELEIFYRGLGRPQGLAFDAEGNVYVAASLQGRRGIVRINQEREAELFLSGPGIVGLAFGPNGTMVTATNSALFRVETGVQGRPLP
jgi:sugar lactone lactonase YvrE